MDDSASKSKKRKTPERSPVKPAKKTKAEDASAAPKSGEMDDG